MAYVSLEKLKELRKVERTLPHCVSGYNVTFPWRKPSKNPPFCYLVYAFLHFSSTHLLSLIRPLVLLLCCHSFAHYYALAYLA